jgi:SNF2 family DNA or RNA helicase
MTLEKLPESDTTATVRVTADGTALESLRPDWLCLQRLKQVHQPWIRWLMRSDAGAETRLRKTGYVLAIGRPRPSSGESNPNLGDLFTPTVTPVPHQPYLTPYQLEGRDWLLSDPVRLLADEMGLGKTVQATAALAKLACQSEYPLRALIVCPTSVVRVWLEHIRRFGSPLWSAGWNRSKTGVLPHVTVTSIASLSRNPPDYQKQWDVLVVDEAHKIRNEGTAAQAAVKQIASERRWFLTGTPLERDDKDLRTLLAAMRVRGFEAANHSYSELEIDSAIARISLRRTKLQVRLEVPRPVEKIEVLSMMTPQKGTYEAIRLAAIAGKIELFAAIGKLREIADYDPGTKTSNKLAYCLEVSRRAAQAREKAVLFSFTLEPLRVLEESLCEDGACEVFWLRGDMSAAERETSIDKFSRSSRGCVMLASSRACAEGVTLTAATVAVLINEWWNPSTNDQIAARIVRFGQTKSCSIIRLRSADTIDERLAAILGRKDTRYRALLEVIERGSARNISPKEANGIKELLL